MHDRRRLHVRGMPSPIHDPFAAPDLFAWGGGGIVLLGERINARWVLARGWRQADRLNDVRRWSFADPRAFAGQVRRLVRDATGDPAAGRQAAAVALAWIAAHGTPRTTDHDRALKADS